MCFTIEMLPANDGDCLWIEYGDLEKPYRILIDGGRGNVGQKILQRIRKVPGERIHFDLIVITHVDRDHIGGILNLLSGTERPFTCGDIWFNGWPHLDERNVETYGPVDGEKLTKEILNQKLPWNKRFSGGAIVVSKEAISHPISYEGGMKITILSPSRDKLLQLKPKWADACRDADIDPRRPPRSQAPSGFEHFGPIDIEGLASSPFDPDKTETNGSSIAFLAEFDKHKILLAGDAHSDILMENIKLVKGKAGKLEIDAFKVPHHGSKANISREILELVACPRYLISTSGGASYHHPDPETMARIIKFGGDKSEFIFNYRSNYSRIWDNKAWMNKYHYTVRYLEDPNADKLIRLA